jgi:cell wall-associated NlpC family hydrolase
MLGSAASRPLVIGATVLALLGPALPAMADPGTPSPADVRAAQEDVQRAERRVASLRERAEHAAEQYNGARVAADRTAQRSERQAEIARDAERQYGAARLEVRHARAAAAAAQAWARQAEDAREGALAAAARHQLELDRIAVGAFRTDGRLGMVSQLFLATDPISLAQAGTVINRIGVHQKHVIEAAHEARAAAEVAVATARVAREQATAAQDRAAASLGRAEAARAQAQQQADAADELADEARAAARTAERAKRKALALVAEAERLLGSARRTAKEMERLAREARAGANGTWDGSAPSQAARTAIQAAFDQIGVPYSWGGGDENGPTEGFAQGAGTVGFDCSGLTLYGYAQAGIHLDHYSQAQWDQGPRVQGGLANVQPGDLLYYAYDTSDPSTIHHVALAIGNGKMIEAPYTGEVVRVASANRSDFIGATRPWA